MHRIGRAVMFLALAAGAPLALADDGGFKVEAFQGSPEGLSAGIAKRISPTGYRVTGQGGLVCEIWFLKEVPLKPKFKPTDVVKYPLQNGELVGAIRFPEKSERGDFRGQNVPPGTYTLRYGQQPLDGNHLGTADVRDFLLICPPKTDLDPQRIEKLPDLFKLSAKSVNTTHPAVFLLMPPPDAPHEKIGVEFHSEKNMLEVHVNIEGKGEGKSEQVPLRVVAIGKSDA